MLFPPIEGYHVASRRIIEAAASAGIDTRVITVESDIKVTKKRNWTTVNAKINSAFLPSVFSAVDDVLTSVNIASYVKYSDLDLIHVLNIAKEAYVIIHGLLRVKKPLLMHFYHSPYVLTDDVFLIRNIAIRVGLYGRILDNHIVTTNLSMLRFFIDRLGVVSDRVHYAPYPVDVNFFKPLKDKWSLRRKHLVPFDRSIVVYTGSLQPARGVSDLINSFRYVSEENPDALLFISHPKRREERIYEKYLYAQIQKLKLGKNVVIRGPCSQIEEIYNIADVIVLPLIRPYWVDPPLVLLEAMSSGAPVITTPVGAIDEVAHDHENALLVRPGDPSLLAKAIIELLESPDESRTIGQKARETIVQKYSYEIVGKNLSKIYNLVLDHSN